MEAILGVITTSPKNFKIHFDDSFADKLSHRITCGILVFFAVFVTSKQMAGEPINCWVPAHFSGSHEEYTNGYCWIRNTYYLPFEEYIPGEGEFHEDKHIVSYYQWVPLILLAQALFFRLPSLLWRSMNERSGIDIGGVVKSSIVLKRQNGEDDGGSDEKAADDVSPSAPGMETIHEEETNIDAPAATETGGASNKAGEPKKNLKYEKACKQMHRYLESYKQRRSYSSSLSFKNIFSKTCFRCCGRQHGNYLIVLFLFCKILYITNLIVQILATNYLLGFNFGNYGFDVMRAMLRDEDWTGSEKFPRVTMCDFRVRRLGNIQRYTVQCVLSVNLFNEKIYLFIWFWFIFVLIISIVSFFTWIRKALFTMDRHRFIKKNIKHRLKGQSEEVRELAEEFTSKYLREDGVFILRLLEQNSDALTSFEFVNDLWDYYLRMKKEHKGTYV